MSSPQIDTTNKPDNRNANNKLSSFALYSSLDYWESRYNQNPVSFDWLEDFDSLKDLLNNVFSNVSKQTETAFSEMKIVNVGCGTSEIPEKIYTNFGIKQIVNVDYSQTVINHMQSQNLKFPEMTWINSDILSYEISPGSFDVIIDKSTSDTFLCLNDCLEKMLLYYKKMFLALKKKGVLLIVSFDKNRELLLKNCGLPFFVETKQMINEFSFKENKDGGGIPEEVLKKESFICSCMKTQDEYDQETFNKLLDSSKKEN